MTYNTYNTQRNLDACFFRVERNGKWMSVCFSDLTEDERERVTNHRTAEWLKSLCFHLADKLMELGDALDIILEFEHE